MNTLVVLNVAHKLLPAQVEQLNLRFGDKWELFPVPEDGWTATRQSDLACELVERQVVFASPVPLLLARLAASKVRLDPAMAFWGLWIFHNDLRIAKEVPDGHGGVKVIHTVAPDGWQLIPV